MAARDNLISLDAYQPGDYVAVSFPTPVEACVVQDNGNGCYTVKFTGCVTFPKTECLQLIRRFNVGDYVSCEDGCGQVSSVNEDNTYTLLWDDSSCEADGTKGLDDLSLISRYQFRVGDYVSARLNNEALIDHGCYYNATVAVKNDDGTYEITWDNAGQKGYGLQPDEMVLITPAVTTYGIGDYCTWNNGDEFNGRVVIVKGDCSYCVENDDGEQIDGLYDDNCTACLGKKEFTEGQEVLCIYRAGAEDDTFASGYLREFKASISDCAGYDAEQGCVMYNVAWADGDTQDSFKKSSDIRDPYGPMNDYVFEKYQYARCVDNDGCDMSSHATFNPDQSNGQRLEFGQCVQVCEFVDNEYPPCIWVTTPLEAANGLYQVKPNESKNGKGVYTSAGGGTLAYEVAGGEQNNWAAESWLACDACWVIGQGGGHRYALASDCGLRDLDTQPWTARTDFNDTPEGDITVFTFPDDEQVTAFARLADGSFCPFRNKDGTDVLEFVAQRDA